MWKIALVTAAFLLRASPAGAFTPAPLAGTEAEAQTQLDALVEEALRSNPQLRAMRHGVEAARHRVPQAGALDDPMAGIAFSNFPLDGFATDDTPMTGIELRLSQKLPWPGKRALREEVASRGVEVAEEVLEEASRQLEAEVKGLFHGIWFLDRALEITGENVDLLREFVDIAGEKYSVGKGVQADVTRAQVALSRLLDRRIALEADREAARGMLNALLDRLPQAPLQIPPRLPEARIDLDLERLQQSALAHRAALARLDRMIAQGEARLALAHKELYPDFTTGLAYRWRDSVPMDPVGGEDFLSASIMVNVPLWAARKQKARIAETREEVRRLEGMRDDLRNAVFARIQGLVEELEGLEEEIDLYESGILIQTEQSLASSRYAYEVDKVDFLSLLDAQIVLLNEEIKYYRVLSEYRQDLARLEAEVGAPLGLVAAPQEREGGRP